MSVTERVSRHGTIGQYEVPDDELAEGSTLAGPKIVTVIKANGSISKVFDVETGQAVLGTFILRHYDRKTGAVLTPVRTGTYLIHPEHQEHRFQLPQGIHVKDTVFALNIGPQPQPEADIPAVYYAVEMTNSGDTDVEVSTLAFADLRGETEHDVRVDFEEGHNGFVAWNDSKREHVRVVASSERLHSAETTLDFAMSLSQSLPDDLSGETKASYDPMAVMRVDHTIPVGESIQYFYVIVTGRGRSRTLKNLAALPNARDSLAQTREHFSNVLGQSAVFTPDRHVNAGVLWAKANMVRVQSSTPTGWGFTNNPTKSNNSVARDTAWFGFGGDYLMPDFVRESLLAYVKRQEPSGMIVEYYDMLTGKTEDYGLNINDNTPLLILALWHHYNVTGDIGFLKDVYDAAVKAGKYMLSQRDDLGLVKCTATGTSDWGIVGWRNVIPNYRLSGATTEVNSECVAALETVSHMGRVLDRHEDAEHFAQEAKSLRDAINTHLLNPANGLYYLNIDLDGRPHSDVTSDLVFPVIFGVASDTTASNIIGRLSSEDFWTSGGIRTSPRDSVTYTPNGGWGLLGGVWVGVSFWYAQAAAAYSPEFMAHALSTTFRNYSSDPRRNNTVPGQFSEWLHGETLVNEGMMLSPWFPPRYLWAAVEGMAGLEISSGHVGLRPKLAPQWKWLAVSNLPFRGNSLTWLAVKAPELQLFTNFHHSDAGDSSKTYDRDISRHVHVSSDSACPLALGSDQRLLVFLGNTEDRSLVTTITLDPEVVEGGYSLRQYDSLLGRWEERDRSIAASDICRGIPVQIERKGFWLFELRQEY